MLGESITSSAIGSELSGTGLGSWIVSGRADFENRVRVLGERSKAALRRGESGSGVTSKSPSGRLTSP